MNYLKTQFIELKKLELLNCIQALIMRNSFIKKQKNTSKNSGDVFLKE